MRRQVPSLYILAEARLGQAVQVSLPEPRIFLERALISRWHAIDSARIIWWHENLWNNRIGFSRPHLTAKISLTGRLLQGHLDTTPTIYDYHKYVNLNLLNSKALKWYSRKLKNYISTSRHIEYIRQLLEDCIPLSRRQVFPPKILFMVMRDLFCFVFKDRHINAKNKT